MSVPDLMRQIAELSLQVQELERIVQDQQDKVGKLQEKWTPLYERYCDPKLHPGDCGCCDWCEIDRAAKELEK